MDVIRTMPVQVALVPYEAESVPASLLTRVAAVLNTQVIRDVAPLWGVSAVVSPFVALEHVPPGYMPLVLVSEDADFRLSSQGFHFVTAGHPGALVKLGQGWSADASHELIEMLCDPSGTATVTGPSLKADQGHVEYLMEVCDPCQSSTYEIHGLAVSDFVTPAYYAAVDAGDAQCSFTGRCKRPRQLLEDGYITWRTPAPDPGIWQALAPRGKGDENAVAPVDKLSITQIDVAPPSLSRHWVDRHEKALHKKRLKRPKSPTAPDRAAARYGGALRTEIALLLKPLTGAHDNFMTVLKNLADPSKETYRERFRNNPGEYFGGRKITPPEELPTPEQYQGVVQALEQGQRFGMDFSSAESIEWLSKLA